MGIAAEAITSPHELINSATVAREQLRDPTLASARFNLNRGSIRKSSYGQMKFIVKKGCLYREIRTPSGETRHQFVVPRQYRGFVLDYAQQALSLGRLPHGKLHIPIEAAFFWPGFSQDIARRQRICDARLRAGTRNRGPA